MIRTLAAALATTTCIVALATPAAAQTREFNIPAGSLRSALDAFARQSGRQVIYRGDEVRSVRSPGVRGARTAEDALDAILAGTGFKAQKDSSGAFAVAKSGNAPTAAETAASLGEDDDNQEIVVTGTNIRGAAPRSSPLSVYSRADIEKSGATTVEQFLSKLPANQATLSGNGSGAVGATAEYNAENINGIDLRGLGVGSTLVLLNGRRLALSAGGRTPDVSLIPVTALKRVEVLTDGASAIYGSDAVAGVVNFILNDDLNGAETVAGFGTVTDGGLKEYHLGQSIGRTWSSGKALVSYDFLKRTPLEASARSYASSASPYTLLPRDTRQGLLGTFEQEAPLGLTVFGDALYSWRKNSSVITRQAIGVRQDVASSERQLFSTLGVRREIAPGITFELIGSYSFVRTSTLFHETDLASGNISDSPSRNIASTKSLDAKLSGHLLNLPGGPLSFSLGGELSRDTFRDRDNDVSFARNYQSAFGEFIVPIFGPDQGISGVRRLEVSLAGRYTHYSDVGATADPKIGIAWEPVTAVRLRGTYGESFRAPTLSRLNPRDSSYIFFRASEVGIPDTFTDDNSATILYATGTGNPNLKPERARTATMGFDVTPNSRLRVRGTYFSISYKDRVAIGDPGGFGILTPAAFPDLLTVNPTAAQVAAVITGSRLAFDTVGIDPADPAAVAAATTIIFDNRIRNLAESKISGFDADVDASFPVLSGTITGGGSLTYIGHYKERISPNAAQSQRVGTLFNPPRVRFRSYIGYTGDRLQVQGNVNYVGAYKNEFSALKPHVGAWVTFDLNASYQLTGLAGERGLRVSVSAQNLFDNDPPLIATSTTGLIEPIGYDPANANPLGRFVNIQLTQRW